MRIVYESDQCELCPKSEPEEPPTTRVSVLNFSLEGKSIHLEPRVREDPRLKNSLKSTSPQQLRIDLQREQGIHIPVKNKPAGRVRKSKAQQRRQSDQRKSVREVVLTRRPSAAPRPLIPPRTPLVISKMSMPTEGQKFSDNSSVVANTADEASNVVKRLMGTNAVVEESTSTKKVSKQVAIKGNVNTIAGQALQQQNSFDNETNNNRTLSEINNQQVSTSQKTVSSTSSTVSSKTTRRESYSTQTQVQESFSSSYEDAEDNTGTQAICSPDQIKSATNINKSSKTSTSKQVKEVRQSTLQQTSSVDSDISSVEDGSVKKTKKDKKNAQQNTAVQTTDTQVQQIRDTEKITAENVDYTEQTKTMSVEEFQKIRTIKEFITIQKKLKNADDNDTEEEEEENYESEKIMSVDDIRKNLSSTPPKEVVNDDTKNVQIVKGSRIEEIRTTTKRIYPNPDNADQPVEQETVTIDRKVVPAGTTIMSNTENTQNTQTQVVATKETAVKKTKKTESQQVKQTKTQTTETGTRTDTQNVVQDTAVQNVEDVNKNVQNVQNVKAVENVQNVQTVEQNVQSVQQNVQNVQQNVQNVQSTQNVQTQNVQNVQTQNVQNVQTQNVQNVQTQDDQKNTQNVQKIQDVQNTQNVQTNTENVNTQQQVQQTKNTQQTTTEETTTQNTDQTQQTKQMTLEEFQNIRKIKEYITSERKMLNADDGDVEEEGETSFEAEIILTLDEIRKRIATTPPKEAVKDTTKDAPIPPGSKILEIRTTTRTILPNPDKNDEKVEQITVLLERTVVPAGTPLIPNAENIPQKQVITAGQETAIQKKTTTETQQVQQTKTQVTETGTDTQKLAQKDTNVQTQTQNVQNSQNVQNTQNTQNVQNTQNTQNVQNIQNTQNVQTTNIQQKNIQETQNVQRNIQETQNVQNVQNIQSVQDIQNTQNEALKKTSVNTVKQSTLTSTSSVDSDTSSLDEASRLNQGNQQLVDTNQTTGGSSVIKQTSSKTTKVTESRKIIKQSSSAAPETFVEEASKTHSSETVVNATCGADGKFNVEENTKTSTTVSSGVGNDEEMKRQIQSQNKNLTKKLVSDGTTVVADVDQTREKVVQEQQGDNITFKQTTSDSKHKRMIEDASKLQPLEALGALPSPDSGSASPQIEMPSFQPNKALSAKSKS